MKKSATEKLEGMLNELGNFIPDIAVISNSVSSANIGWHLDHALLVINAIVDATEKSEPSKFKKKFNFAKIYVFSLGRIPHKKARAPKAVTPKTPATREELEMLIASSREQVSKLPELDPKKFFKHPIFGDLRLKDTIRFLELHTEHHLKIMRAIKAESLQN